MKPSPLHINKPKQQKNTLSALLLSSNLSVFLVISSFFFSLTRFAATLSLHLSVFSLFLSPTLLLTSSAVLRPLHEANAHSGLAVAACMRSTGGPIKRRQEQEQETEPDTGNVHPQGPRRYHHCPVPHVSTRHLVSSSSSPFPSTDFCCQLSVVRADASQLEGHRFTSRTFCVEFACFFYEYSTFLTHAC